MFGIERGRPGRAGDAIVVSDSSTDIGRAIAVQLAEHGFRVFAGVRDSASRSDLLDAAGERGVELEMLGLDPADSAAVEEAVRSVVTAAGGIFGVVTSSAGRLRGALEDISEEEIHHAFETNVLGAVMVTKAVVPHLRSAGCGRIITITSAGGDLPGYGVSIESAMKYALEGVAEGLALELAPFGVQSIVVASGIVNAQSWLEVGGTAAAAHDIESPYYGPFWAADAIAGRIVESSPTMPSDVASVVETALTAEEPRLQYVVGPRASAVSFLRRHLPARLFERLYYGGQLRRIERRVDPALLPPAREAVSR